MEVLDRLIKFSTIRPRTEFEVKRWLIRKKIEEKDSEVALSELKKAQLINDENFCRWWIEQRTTFRPKAPKLLVLELLKKGVDKELARQIVGEADLNEEELVWRLMEKKKKSWSKLEPETRKKKTIAFLAFRGFNWSVIKKYLKD
ncbi:regulatory protein RecX [Candidatus Microgenomates bacterium]|nr:regulatory protein RecX [Candidatus Microgenomates bacterium]